MRKAICFLIIYSAAPESVALKLYHCYCSCLERGGCSDGPDPSCLSPPTYFSSLQYWWAAGPSRLQQRLKAPSWTPDRRVGSVILVEPAGRRGPQKEIKGRNVFENKYKAETRLKRWRVSPCRSSGGRSRSPSLSVLSANRPLTFQLMIFICTYYTRTHRESTSAAHDHHSPPFTIVHLRVINLVWSALTCSQQW